MKILIDSSVIIDFTRAGLGEFLDVVLPENQIYIPTIVISELWAGESMDKKRESGLVEKIIASFERVNLNETVARMAGELIRTGAISGFDAIIAATALEMDICLATSNKKHFRKIPGLKLFKMQKGS